MGATASEISVSGYLLTKGIQVKVVTLNFVGYVGGNGLGIHTAINLGTSHEESRK